VLRGGLLGAGLATTLAAAPARAQPGGTTCSSVALSTRVGGQTGTIPGTLCVPPGARSVELLLHGYSYGQYYWDLPFEPETYSFVRAANAAGFATLNVDRLGNVGSLQPLSLFVTLDNNASVAHQLVSALRSGELGVAFENVVVVGHSFGSLIAYLEAGRFQDVDALVATGASHEPNAVNIATRVVASSPPAILDPKFRGLLLDPGYVTTRPGARGIFYEAADADPAVIALDEQLKQTGTLEDTLTTLPDFLLNASSDINIPTLTVNGSEEPFFCNGVAAGDCSSSAALAASEQPFYGPDAQVEAIVVNGAGHNLALELGAAQTNTSIQEWLVSLGL